MKTHLIVVLACSIMSQVGEAQTACPGAANAQVNAGWAAYRANDVERARAAFDSAAARCRTHPGALTGQGYVHLRLGRIADAERAFRAATASTPTAVDAWIGLGFVAWRKGDLDATKRAFERVRALDPANADARDYLARIAAARGESTAPRVQRAPLVKPKTVQYPARAIADRFEIRTASGWQPFYVKGVNIGAAMPGMYPSEFPDSATYARWLVQIGELGANTIRVYTMHPPELYAALRAYNRAHKEPLWLIHGVWAELPPEDIHYDDPVWEREFFDDIHSVIDILHGRADIVPRPGRAGGHYTADVSQWTLGLILGREWESHSVAGWNALRPGLRSFAGHYLQLVNGTPMDAWMTKASEEAVRYEMETYNAQRPVAYTNWPTTDPLTHPAESSIMEEAAIRRALGDDANIRHVVEGEDVVTLDPNLVKATSTYPAGWFASYHVYPYFPDFMVMSREFNQSISPFGHSNYWGYISALKQHHRGVPLLISEYGVPSSIGIAHLHPQGWHHGGNTERFMAEVNDRLTREIAESGAAGGIVFGWIDEWFKKTWNTAPFEVPLDRNRLWHNRMDAEEHYGLVAMDAVLEMTPQVLYAGSGGGQVRAAADASYLWLYFEPGDAPADEIMIGLDVIDAAAGGFAWPGKVGRPLPAGIEFVLHVTRDQARLLAHPSSNPIRIQEGYRGVRGAPLPYPPIERRPPGFFRGRFGYGFNLPLVSKPTSDGVFEPLRSLTSRSRWMRDSTEIGALGYEWGILPRGALPDGLWERNAKSGALEVRIPWQLINVSDPSSRRVLREPRPRLKDGEELDSQIVPDIGILIAARAGDGPWREWPASASRTDVARFTWSTWEKPVWRARLKPAYDALRQTWRTLDPPVVRKGAAR